MEFRFPLQFGFAFVLLSALCAAVAALRHEELPRSTRFLAVGATVASKPGRARRVPEF